MRRIPLLFLLAALSALNVSPQSGRRITTPVASTPAAPVQPPLTPEPEIKTTSSPPPLTNLMFLSESTRDRPIKGLDNKNFRISDFEGKVVVINLWASWCGPCRREVPEYEKVRKAYIDRNVVFIGLTTEDPRYESERVQKFVRDVGFSFRLGYADRELARALTNGRRAIPQTMVIDLEGRIIHHWDGYTPGHSGEQLKRAIEQALTRE
ncbi:MAG TPA: TlpA disulfide reductase family protein [Pyrinomonadaceae bacterium]|nr:TlpA disulfide reductase family protein [Pyrinomonadaceae bacterium]